MYKLGRIGANIGAMGRMIGNIAFPLLCFLLVECFYHTEDRKKHLIKLWAIAFVSERPYDIAFSLSNPHLNPESVFNNAIINQNMCWAFVYGFAALMAANIDWKKKSESFTKTKNLHRL